MLETQNSKLKIQNPKLNASHTPAQAWIERLAIKTRSSVQPTKTLSGANQQKVALARLLHQDVDVLLLDEPTCYPTLLVLCLQTPV